MALEDIEVFTEVVDAKSFTRAAKRLGMPTSTVSSKIARLEKKSLEPLSFNAPRVT